MTLVLDGTNNTYLSATERGQLMTLSTAQATTSGTSIDFTSIPTWAKRITVIFNGVSTNGTSAPGIQIGSGSVETTGYVSGSSSSVFTTGFFIAFASAANTISGHMVLINISGNIWIANGSLQNTTGSGGSSTAAGSKTTSGTLDRVRITTSNGTDTFDAGSVNILIEGSL